jgi:hypothetical protein
MCFPVVQFGSNSLFYEGACARQRKQNKLYLFLHNIFLDAGCGARAVRPIHTMVLSQR